MNIGENKLVLSESPIDSLIDVICDYSEIPIDSIIIDDTLKEIPIIKTVVAIIKTGKSFRDLFLRIKLIEFLKAQNDMPQVKKDKFASKILNANDEKRSNIGMQILFILENADSKEKAALIGKAFTLFAKEEITLSFFLKLSYLINRCYYDDLLALKHFEDEDSIILSVNPKIPTETLDGLFSNGLLNNNGIDGGNFTGAEEGTCYGLNAYSIVLKKLI